MAGVNVANNPIGSYPVKVTKEGSGSATVNVQHVIVDSGSISTGGTTPLTPASPGAATVGVASGSVLAANASRTGLVLVNTSTNTISIGFGAAAVLNSGITLTPNGAFTMQSSTFTTTEIFAIASGAGSNLAIQEYS